jgi:hypothetical protein
VIPEVTSREACRLVDRAFGSHGLEGGAGAQHAHDGLGLLAGPRQNQADADLFGRAGKAQLFLIEGLDRLVSDGAVDHRLDQHITEDAVAGDLKAALDQRAFVQAPAFGLAGQQFLVDDLVQNPAEQAGGHVQRLALADQALGDRLALDVRGPDGVTRDPGHGLVARFRRPVAAPIPVTGRQGQRQHQGGQKKD